MSDLATMQAQLEALKAARRSGTRRVSVEGFSAEYRDDNELAREIAALEAEIAGTASPRNIIVRATKGW